MVFCRAALQSKDKNTKKFVLEMCFTFALHTMTRSRFSRILVHAVLSAWMLLPCFVAAYFLVNPYIIHCAQTLDIAISK